MALFPATQITALSFRTWLNGFGSFLVFGLSFFCAELAGQERPATTESVLFTNAHVIVGDGTEIQNTNVLIRGSEILSIGQDSVADRVVDLSGKTLLPTLIDAHAHLGYQSIDGWGAEYYSRDNLIKNLQQYLYYGFGAVFSAGSDPDDLALALQQELRNGTAVAADFLFAAGMAPPDEGPNNQFLVHTSRLEQSLGMTILRGLSLPEQARLQVQAVAEKGIDFIKIWVDDRGGSQTKLSPQLYRAVSAAAQQQDIKVFVHQQFATDMSDLLSAGVHGFLHGRIGEEFTQATAEQVAEAGAFIVPNLGLAELRREAIATDPFLGPFLTEESSRRLGESPLRKVVVQRQVGYEAELRAGLARLRMANADLVLGTDAGAVPDHPFGYTGHRELEIYVRLGVPPMEAIVAATGNAAKHLGLNDRGRIAPGYRADLLILNSNPLDSIRNTRDIHAVYFRGEETDREGLLQTILQ
ncbi:MAG: amidohydrolase family protein [Pseudomonadales bacterium]|nr:amidohydrolase family protein [Pseudomonadales bacterium]